MTVRRTIALIATAAAGITGSAATMSPIASATTTASVARQVQAGISLNVRSGPGTAYAVTGTLAGATMVTGTVSGAWLKITSGSYAGKYVSTAYLLTPPAAPVNSGPGQKVGFVMADTTTYGASVNVRSAASTTSSIVAHLAPNTRVVGTPVGDGTWWKISNGYIDSALLTTTTSNPLTINSMIPLDQLCLIPQTYYSRNGTDIGYGYTESTPRYFQCKALPNLIALENAYHAHFGTYAGIDNAYRTWDEQRYWYNLYHPQGVAVSPPGKSNHGYGLAVDFQANYHDLVKGAPVFKTFEKDGEGRNWIVANGLKYGFDDIGSGDAPHFNFVG